MFIYKKNFYIDLNNGLDRIISAAKKFNADAFIYAIKYKDVRIDKIVAIGETVARYYNFLKKEYDTIKEYGKYFNGMYAPPDNEYFNTMTILLHKLRRTLKQTKEIDHFCTPYYTRRQHKLYSTIGYPNHHMFEMSFMNFPHEGELFYDEFGPEVQGTYNEMKRFMDLLIDCLKECKRVILEEQVRSQDPNYIMYVHDEQYNDIARSISDISEIVATFDPQIVQKNPLISALRNKTGEERAEIIVNLYHKVQTKHMEQYVAFDINVKKRGMGLDACDIKVFGNAEKAEYAINIIKNFNSLLPADNGKKLRAEYIALFLKYFGVKDVKNGHKVFVKHYNGKKSPVGYGPVLSVMNDSGRINIFLNTEEGSYFNDKLTERMKEVPMSNYPTVQWGAADSAKVTKTRTKTIKMNAKSEKTAFVQQ